MSDSSADRDPLERLAEEFIARLRAGERPALSEYAERYPELADQILELFPALVEMEQLKPVTADHSEAFVSSVKPSDPERVGEFRILRRIGHGGMGVVYEAVQESLGRHVALKLLPPDSLADPNRLERFRREAKSAARLHHTNIVPVYGTGEADGRHYYAMQFIDGHPLDAVIHEVRRVKAKSADGPAPRAITEVAAALMTGTFTRLSPSVAGAATVTYIHHTLPPATPLAVGESPPHQTDPGRDPCRTTTATPRSIERDGPPRPRSAGTPTLRGIEQWRNGRRPRPLEVSREQPLYPGDQTTQRDLGSPTGLRRECLGGLNRSRSRQTTSVAVFAV